MPVSEAQDVTVGPAGLPGRFGPPSDGMGVVLFAHGSGGGRLSPRNNHVADVLRVAGLGTLLFDLLTPEEAADRANVFDIPLLGGRLAMAAEWLRGAPDLARQPLGYFGASTGAAAALVASTMSGGGVSAIVSRGGRPDLAGDALHRVTAPTLLIVGGADEPTLSLNRHAYEAIRAEKDMVIVPGATHLFEETGALDAVTRHARDWFVGHLTQAR